MVSAGSRWEGSTMKTSSSASSTPTPPNSPGRPCSHYPGCTRMQRPPLAALPKAAAISISASQHLSKYLLERGSHTQPGFSANDAVDEAPQREHDQLKQLPNKAEMLTSGGASRSVLKC